ncbi:MAG: hypothetical protein ACOX9B_15205 [Candidatus Xenobium sp.]|nr:hypothetical protein [Burkholderiales bacterium]
MVFGVLRMLVREHRTLDGRARTLNNWSCLEGLAFSEPIELGEVKTVLIDRESKLIRYQKRPDTVEDRDNVWLLNRKGERHLLDSLLNKPFEARRLAEAASRLLGADYCDTTCNPPENKTCSELDESLGQRYLRQARPLPKLRKPPSLSFRCIELPEALDIRIPQGNLVDFWRPFLCGVGIFLAALVGWTMLWGGDWKGPLMILLVSIMPYTLPWLCTTWPASRLTESLFLSRRSLKVESTMYGRHEIPLEELEDLILLDFRENQLNRNFQAERYFPVGYLCARSDRVEARFGGSLDEANLEYLRALLVNRIVEYTRKTEGQGRTRPEPAEGPGR